MACKPGSVLARARDGHSSGTLVTERLTRPTRTAAGNNHCRPYSVLLLEGLAVPPPLPGARCALTAPFQPCPGISAPSAVCFLLRFPWSRLRRMLSGTMFPRSPDFPPARRRAAIRPSDARNNELQRVNVNVTQQRRQNGFALTVDLAIDSGRPEMPLE